jgi:hypothetical protein
MKKSVLIVLLAMATFSVKAQYAKIDKYPYISEDYEAVFVDVVRNFASKVMNGASGQYFGQYTPEGEAYGFGTLYTDQNGIAVGAYRNGSLLFGIRSGLQLAKVGTEQHYVVYDLVTSECLYVMMNGVKCPPDAANKEAWKYVQIKYGNGAKYVGETVNGKRDGYGIYYFADGDYFYGHFVNDRPLGYGALFKTNNHVVIQYWELKKN